MRENATLSVKKKKEQVWKAYQHVINAELEHLHNVVATSWRRLKAREDLPKLFKAGHKRLQALAYSQWSRSYYD